jgi:hypothetical protein
MRITDDSIDDVDRDRIIVSGIFIVGTEVYHDTKAERQVLPVVTK